MADEPQVISHDALVDMLRSYDRLPKELCTTPVDEVTAWIFQSGVWTQGQPTHEVGRSWCYAYLKRHESAQDDLFSNRDPLNGVYKHRFQNKFMVVYRPATWRAIAVFPEPNQVAGHVRFEPSDNGVLVKAFFSQLPPGEHGFHIHKAGDLSGQGCKGACDHYHVGPPADHGGAPDPLNDTPRHTGDLGNISQAPCHKQWELVGVDIKDLFGRSVIVHADADDLGTGPFPDSKTTGHSGARIACAIIGRVDCQPGK
jgi:Cu-Zn family superoxide dismutase